MFRKISYLPRQRLGAVTALWTGLFLLVNAASGRAEPLASELTSKVNLPGFGDIAYRAPLPHVHGPTLVLVHGVFAGSTHLSFKELLPLLDTAGAQVYILDLPGTGESASPKRTYSMSDLDQFLAAFLDNVVRDKSVIVSESLLGTTALQVAATRPDLVSQVVLLSPTGVHTLADPPAASQTALFNQVYGSEIVGLPFYEVLLSDPSLRYFLQRAYYDPSLVTDALLNEYRAARTRLGQQWISFAFVGGQLFRKFADVAPAVTVPVLAIFGKEAKSPAPGVATDTVADFSAIRPDFTYQEVEHASLSVQREQPDAVAKLILDFVK